MRTYGLWFIFSLPLLALGLFWKRLPPAIVIHSASSDNWVTRDDFGGIVIGVMITVALLAYGLLQLQRAFQPMTQKEVNNAYATIAIGSSLIGLVLVGIGLLGH